MIELAVIENSGPTVAYVLKEEHWLFPMGVPHGSTLMEKKAELHKLTWVDIYLKYAKRCLSGVSYYRP